VEFWIYVAVAALEAFVASAVMVMMARTRMMTSMMKLMCGCTLEFLWAALYDSSLAAPMTMSLFPARNLIQIKTNKKVTLAELFALPVRELWHFIPSLVKQALMSAQVTSHASIRCFYARSSMEAHVVARDAPLVWRPLLELVV